MWLARVPQQPPPATAGLPEQLAAGRAHAAARGDPLPHVLRDALTVDLESVVLQFDDDELLEDEE